jgi:hypothetical protein
MVLGESLGRVASPALALLPGNHPCTLLYETRLTLTGAYRDKRTALPCHGELERRIVIE